MPADVQVVVESAADGGFTAVSEAGVTLRIDVAPDQGGGEDSWRPTELLLAALGGCLAIDVTNILRKKRREASSYRIVVQGKPSEEPAGPFVRLEAIHTWDGTAPSSMVQDVIRLVAERYCTIQLTIARGTEIRHSLGSHDEG